MMQSPEKCSPFFRALFLSEEKITHDKKVVEIRKVCVILKIEQIERIS